MVGDYAKQTIEAANAYDAREEELLTMFEQLEEATIGTSIRATQKEERPKAIATMERTLARAPMVPEELLEDDKSDESSIRQDIQKIQEYIRSKGYNIMITAKLDRDTISVLGSMGVDVSFLEEAFQGDVLNPYAHIADNQLKYIDPIGYYDAKAEEVKNLAIQDVRRQLNELMLNPQIINSIWDDVGLYHTLLEGSYGQVYYNILAGQTKGLEDLELILGIADNSLTAFKSYGAAVEATGGNLYFAVPLSFVIFALDSHKDMPGEKPSDLDTFFGWTEARQKEIYRSARKLEYIMNSDYLYLMNLNGYKKKILKNLYNIKQDKEKENVFLYEDDAYNKLYKESQLEYIDHISNSLMML